MPVLIDGNNLLYAAWDAEPDRIPSRETLCQKLGQWARITGEKVTIVFDGPRPPADRARQISAVDVAVSYSGGCSADDVLIHMLETDSAARRLLVVSSDREIAHAARRRRAKPIRSDEYWERLTRDLARRVPPKPEPPEKRKGLGSGEADEWLREMGLDGAEPGVGPDNNN